jgi:hypothetical protein
VIEWPYITVAVFALAIGGVVGWYVAKKHIVRAGGDMAHLFQRAVSALLLILAAASVVQLVYFQHEQAEQARTLASATECQYQVNKVLLDVLKTRGVPQDEGNQRLVVMAESILNAKTREESRKAIEDFIVAMKKLNETRGNTPYPDIPLDCRP